MCFDCSAFQYQLDKVNTSGDRIIEVRLIKMQEKPMENHIFQTIFLNKKHDETWSKDEIRKDKICESLA